jgi:UDP-3-O-[3-hydroxymyristoyl] glucosamine N-acyltransferase
MKTREIADLLKGEVHGDEEAEIHDVASVEKAEKGEIAFIEKLDNFTSTNASCLIIPPGFDLTQAETRVAGSVPATISARNPKLAFALIAEVLHPPKKRSPEIHPTAVIAGNARIAKDVFIGAFTCVGENSSIGDGTQLRAGAKIGDNVTIGKNCILHPNVFIEDGCTIGDNVILHSGVVIGTDGFGYVRDSERYVKFPQIGTVVIEDDVEIGANTCVDRGALGETRIGAGTKIDNLVQVGHNVNIGRRCVIAAQTGISGSTVIEDDCVIGGQVGFGDHAHVQSGAIIGSQAGVLPGKIVRPGIWWGTPIQPLDEYKRQNAHLKGIERLKAEIKEMKKRLNETSSSGKA